MMCNPKQELPASAASPAADAVESVGAGTDGTCQSIFTAAMTRWLNVAELETLLRPETSPLSISMKPPTTPPPSGTVLLYDREATRNYKEDGHNWIRKKSSSRIREDHVKLRVAGRYRIAGSYVHHATSSTMKRRAYHLVDPETGRAPKSGPSSLVASLCASGGPASVELLQRLGSALGRPQCLVLVHYLDTDLASKQSAAMNAQVARERKKQKESMRQALDEARRQSQSKTPPGGGEEHAKAEETGRAPAEERQDRRTARPQQPPTAMPIATAASRAAAVSSTIAASPAAAVSSAIAASPAAAVSSATAASPAAAVPTVTAASPAAALSGACRAISISGTPAMGKGRHSSHSGAGKTEKSKHQASESSSDTLSMLWGKFVDGEDRSQSVNQTKKPPQNSRNALNTPTLGRQHPTNAPSQTQQVAAVSGFPIPREIHTFQQSIYFDAPSTLGNSAPPSVAAAQPAASPSFVVPQPQPPAQLLGNQAQLTPQQQPMVLPLTGLNLWKQQMQLEQHAKQVQIEQHAKQLQMQLLLQQQQQQQQQLQQQKQKQQQLQQQRQQQLLQQQQQQVEQATDQVQEQMMQGMQVSQSAAGATLPHAASMSLPNGAPQKTATFDESSLKKMPSSKSRGEPPRRPQGSTAPSQQGEAAGDDTLDILWKMVVESNAGSRARSGPAMAPVASQVAGGTSSAAAPSENLQAILDAGVSSSTSDWENTAALHAFLSSCTGGGSNLFVSSSASSDASCGISHALANKPPAAATIAASAAAACAHFSSDALSSAFPRHVQSCLDAADRSAETGTTDSPPAAVDLAAAVDAAVEKQMGSSGGGGVGQKNRRAIVEPRTQAAPSIDSFSNLLSAADFGPMPLRSRQQLGQQAQNGASGVASSAAVPPMMAVVGLQHQQRPPEEISRIKRAGSRKRKGLSDASPPGRSGSVPPAAARSRKPPNLVAPGSSSAPATPAPLSPRADHGDGNAASVPEAQGPRAPSDGGALRQKSPPIEIIDFTPEHAVIGGRPSDAAGDGRQTKVVVSCSSPLPDAATRDGNEVSASVFQWHTLAAFVDLPPCPRAAGWARGAGGVEPDFPVDLSRTVPLNPFTYQCAVPGASVAGERRIVLVAARLFSGMEPVCVGVATDVAQTLKKAWWAAFDLMEEEQRGGVRDRPMLHALPEMVSSGSGIQILTQLSEDIFHIRETM